MKSFIAKFYSASDVSVLRVPSETFVILFVQLFDIPIFSENSDS